MGIISHFDVGANGFFENSRGGYWLIIAVGYISKQLEILTVCIFCGFYRTGADFSCFCISAPVFTMDTRTLLDEFLDSHGPSGLFVSFEGPDYNMLLLKSQSAVINGHY